MAASRGWGRGLLRKEGRMMVKFDGGGGGGGGGGVEYVVGKEGEGEGGRVVEGKGEEVGEVIEGWG